MKTIHIICPGILVLPGTWELAEKIGAWREKKIWEYRTRDTLKQLERLRKLYESGVITEEELQTLKEKLKERD